MMEVERRASEGAYSMGGKRDMNFQAQFSVRDSTVNMQTRQIVNIKIDFIFKLIR